MKDDNVFMTIGAHYLCNNCDGCPFYDIAGVCDSKPINCKWILLHGFFFDQGKEGERK